MADRFATYSEMTESGDGLFCEIPASWGRLRIKQLFQIRKDIAGRLGYPVWSVTQHGIREKDITSGEGQLSMDYSKYQLLRVGDLVMNHMDLITGGVDIGFKEGVTSPDYRVFIPRRQAEVSKQYFVYLFRLCYWTRKFYSLGQGSAHLGRWRLPRRAFESIVVPVPTLSEQKQIAAFLDYETAKIDALIEKQQQLIALLGEKRQAVISHAVTKGLNPDAPMRDSGVEWLGEVPEHWSIARVKYVSHRISKGDTPSNFGMDFAVDGPVRFIKIENIGAGELIDEPRTSISYLAHNQIKRSHLQANDIVFAIAGATTGKCAIIREEHLPANTNQAVAYVRPNGRVFPKFLIVWLQNQQLQKAMWEMTSQSAQPNLSMENLGNLPVVIPPIDEQTEIAAHAYAKTKNFDLLETKANNAVELLQERRTALISAAVTGKIDVRGWKPPSADSQLETEMEVA